MNARPERRAFPVIDTRSFNTPYERGKAYASKAQRQVQQSLLTYKKLFASCGLEWTEVCRRATAYRDCIGWLDPHLIEEIEGIAAGTGTHFEEILALNCRTEILPASLFNNVADSGECTAIAVSSKSSADGHTWLAQNWDWLGEQRFALVVLQTMDSDGTPISTLTEAGMLAKIGLNARGMAVGLNILRTLDDGARPGIPVHALLRHALSFDSLSSFRNRLEVIAQGPGFGAGSNIPCADATGDVACFELSPRGWAEHPAQDGVAVHTNHFLCGPLAPRQAELGASLSTESRLQSATAHAAARPVSVEAIENLLRDKSDGFTSICRSPDPSLPAEARLETVAGIRTDCTERRWWIAPDIPSQVRFEEAPTGF